MNPVHAQFAWEPFAVLNPPAAVLSLLQAPVGSPSGGLWAGGPGGLAWRPDPATSTASDESWQTPRVPLRSVAALASCDGALLAGGTDGIARSDDAGRTWQRARTQGVPEPVAAFATLGSVAVAGTLGAGVLRSDDGGRNWSAETFGLPGMEVPALARGEGESIIAGTDNGIARSPNGGLAWRATAGTQGVSIADLALTGARGIAVGDDGTVFGSADGGASWEQVGALPAGVEPGALFETASGELLVGAAAGIWHSADAGHTWTAVCEHATYCFAEVDGSVVAGTMDGLAHPDASLHNWRVRDVPPVHDLSRLVVAAAGVFVVGHVAGLVRCALTPEPLPSAPPALAVEPDPAGGLVLSAPDGLWRSPDAREWERAAADAVGSVQVLTFEPDGTGWAAGPGGRLLCSPDGGRTWKQVDAPWGMVDVVAMRALGNSVLVATFDPARHTAELWRTHGGDGRAGWQRSARVPMSVPSVAMCADPPTAVLGRSWFVRDDSGSWRRPTGPPGTVLRLAGQGDALLALTDATVAASTDRGTTWQSLDAPPASEVVDIAFAGAAAYALLTGGRVWRSASLI